MVAEVFPDFGPSPFAHELPLSPLVTWRDHSVGGTAPFATSINTFPRTRSVFFFLTFLPFPVIFQRLLFARGVEIDCVLLFTNWLFRASSQNFSSSVPNSPLFSSTLLERRPSEW